MIVNTADATLTLFATDVADARRLIALAGLDPDEAATLWEGTTRVEERMTATPLDTSRFVPGQAIRTARRLMARRQNGNGRLTAVRKAVTNGVDYGDAS
jgi:hypothetical protein